MVELRKLIGHTFGTRLIQSGAGFLISVLLARWLGPEGKGLASLLLLNLTFSVMVHNLVGGGALVYLIPKFGWGKLKTISMGWAFISAGMVSLGVALWSETVLPVWAVFGLGLILNLNTLYQYVHMGQDRIKVANGILVWQSLALILIALGWKLIFEEFTLEGYGWALLSGYGLGWVYGLWKMPAHSPWHSPERESTKQTLKLGSYSQGANIFQLGSYRLSYYFIEAWLSTVYLGIYSLAMNLAELLWLPSKALATVLYTKVSNTSDEEEAVHMTKTFTFYAFGLTAIGCLGLAFIPDVFYQWVFGKGFEGIQQTLWFLLPGILALATSNNLTHYLNGRGKNLENTRASGLGFLITLGGCFFLIPRFGIQGAAATASISYLSSCIYLFFRFRKLIYVSQA